MPNRVTGSVNSPGPHTTGRTGPYHGGSEESVTGATVGIVSISEDHPQSFLWNSVLHGRCRVIAHRHLPVVSTSSVRSFTAPEASGPFAGRVTRRQLLPARSMRLLRPLLTPRRTTRPLLDRRQCLGGRLKPALHPIEASPGKSALFRCTTPRFTSGSEIGTSLCCASSSVPSALYRISVRGLTSLT